MPAVDGSAFFMAPAAARGGWSAWALRTRPATVRRGCSRSKPPRRSPAPAPHRRRFLPRSPRRPRPWASVGRGAVLLQWKRGAVLPPWRGGAGLLLRRGGVAILSPPPPPPPPAQPPPQLPLLSRIAMRYGCNQGRRGGGGAGGPPRCRSRRHRLRPPSRTCPCQR